MGTCAGGAISGGGVDVWAEQNSGGSSTGPGSGSGGSGDSTVDWPFDPTDPGAGTAAARNCDSAVSVCRDNVTVNSPGTDPIVQNTVITLADLVSFRPQAPTNFMEPNGWMVVGLPANFYSNVTSQVVDGQLLGFPASVRFTPVGFHWEFGDGGTATVGSGGASWATLGLPEFSSTPTSHVYRAPGTFTISLSVGYSAQYRFAGQDWRSVAGTLPIRATDLVAVAGQAQTVLVDRDCQRNPVGPGC